MNTIEKCIPGMFGITMEGFEVEKLTNPKVLNPVEYRISRNGKEFFNIEEIYVFNGREEEYWHICFKKEEIRH